MTDDWVRLKTPGPERWKRVLGGNWSVTVELGIQGWWFKVWRGEHWLARLGGGDIPSRKVAQAAAEESAANYMASRKPMLKSVHIKLDDETRSALDMMAGAAKGREGKRSELIRALVRREYYRLNGSSLEERPGQI